ncbi:iron-sulfur cluster biosynthesis family protein [Peribacillus kribbensis]|uniref:iron-sulfur cluster biosynthesis family protein n=1 Tax=Peribacillus kribbensis TaxID=356658 RepID=UPI0004253D61|nr:iron-sulfur cluster biosynthesis family protein [Peribacillus kribbensis]
MQVEWTRNAKTQLQKRIEGKRGFLKLKYDTEGCGCVVSGVTALWLEKEAVPEEEEVQTNAGPLYVETSKKIFLDEVLKIDFIEETHSFRLSSDNEILNARLSFRDYTG